MKSVIVCAPCAILLPLPTCFLRDTASKYRSYLHPKDMNGHLSRTEEPRIRKLFVSRTQCIDFARQTVQRLQGAHCSLFFPRSSMAQANNTQPNRPMNPSSVCLLLDVLTLMARCSQVSGVARKPYFVMFSRIRRELVARIMTMPRLIRPECCILVMRSEER